MPDVPADDRYQFLRNVIKTPDRAVKIKYKNRDPDWRLVFPHVIGTSTQGSAEVNMVLCAIESGQAEPKKYRCFNVDDLKINDQTYDWSNASIPKLKFRQVRKQSSIDDVDIYR
jgi:hypothetical protein